jgi:GNAT superfamily N-acetyltransferase
MSDDIGPAYSITRARIQDLSALASIELAAARMLVGHAPESVLAECTPIGDFEVARKDGLLWVALAGDNPVGFAHAKMVEPNSAHLDELDVHPTHGRRGLGTRLVNAVCAWAAGAGLESVTLCTFRHVPWNMPFYARLGFEVLRTAELTDELRRVVHDETRRGLDPRRRVVMRIKRPFTRYR